MIPLIFQVLENGLGSIPYGYTILKILIGAAIIYGLKSWFGGAVNRAERVMHGKVVMMTVSAQPARCKSAILTRGL